MALCTFISVPLLSLMVRSEYVISLNHSRVSIAADVGVRVGFGEVDPGKKYSVAALFV